MQIPVRHEASGTTGAYSPLLVVEGDGPVAAGREIYGQPKKAGRITLGAHGDLLVGTVTRNDITIVTASATGVLTIPAAALRGTAGDYRVQVLGADGTPTTRPVTVGLVTSTDAEIRSGLNEGEMVVTGTAADRLATNRSPNGFDRGFGPAEAPVVVNGGGPGTFTRP